MQDFKMKIRLFCSPVKLWEKVPIWVKSSSLQVTEQEQQTELWINTLYVRARSVVPLTFLWKLNLINKYAWIKLRQYRTSIIGPILANHSYIGIYVIQYALILKFFLTDHKQFVFIWWLYTHYFLHIWSFFLIQV